MPHERWSAEAWSVVRVEFRRALALRSQIRRAGVLSTHIRCQLSHLAGRQAAHQALVHPGRDLAQDTANDCAVGGRLASPLDIRIEQSRPRAQAGRVVQANSGQAKLVGRLEGLYQRLGISG